MANFTMRHVFNTDADTFWEKIFFDDDFNKKLYEDTLGFGYELIEIHRGEGGAITRKVRTTPKADIPAAMKKLIGDGLSYVETGRFDVARKRWVYTVEPSKLADKIQIAGEFWVEPKGDKQIERVATHDLKVSIFGLGKMVEGFIEKSTRESFEKAAAFTNRFIQDNGL